MSVRTFIAELQNAEPGRKVRWLIGLTIVAVTAILGAWILITPAAPPPSGDLVRKEDQPTFFEKIAISTNQVIGTLRIKTANTINFFSKKLKRTNTIEIQTETTPAEIK